MMEFIRDEWRNGGAPGRIMVSFFAAVIVFVAALSAWFVFAVADDAMGEARTARGVVVARSFTPARVSHGTGYGVMPNGKSGVIATSNHEAERFTVIVRLDAGGGLSCATDASGYAVATEGAPVIASFRVGRWTHGVRCDGVGVAP